MEIDKDNVLRHLRNRRDYFAAKDLRNGWSGIESGPCCDACAMRDEHFNGRADALKAALGCRNPFQLPKVCECHVPTRTAVLAGIVEALNQSIRHFEKLVPDPPESK